MDRNPWHATVHGVTTERLNCTENWGKDFTHIIWFSYVICSQLEKVLSHWESAR